MYNIEDRVLAIKAVQELLGVKPTGLFNEETTNAIIKIQESYGLITTGVVDFTTHEAIVLEAKKIKHKYNSDYKFPFTLGEFSEEIADINRVIREAISKYTYEEDLPKGRGITIDTINASKRLSLIYGLDFTGEINELLYNRILCELLID